MTDLENLLTDLATNKVRPEDLEKVFDEVAVRYFARQNLLPENPNILLKK